MYNCLSKSFASIAASVKTVSDLHVGDTITLEKNPCENALPGYKPMKPMVFSGIYPIDSSKYNSFIY